jgi:hypothetical protein
VYRLWDIGQGKVYRLWEGHWVEEGAGVLGGICVKGWSIGYEYRSKGRMIR